MCCNNTFCNAEADIENFEAKNLPRQAEHPTINTYGTNQRQTQDRNAAIRSNTGAPMSMYSGSISYERGQTRVDNNFSQYGGMQAATSNQGHYDEPQIDVLANSRSAQLADALGQSGHKQDAN